MGYSNLPFLGMGMGKKRFKSHYAWASSDVNTCWKTQRFPEGPLKGLLHSVSIKNNESVGMTQIG